MSEAPVLWTLDARGVATVTLNRPQVNNAYNGAMIQALHDAMDTLGKEAGLRVVVLKGNGKHFQAGADLTWINAARAGTPADNLVVSRATATAVIASTDCPFRSSRWCRGDASGAVLASSPPAIS